MLQPTVLNPKSQVRMATTKLRTIFPVSRSIVKTWRVGNFASSVAKFLTSSAWSECNSSSCQKSWTPQIMAGQPTPTSPREIRPQETLKFGLLEEVSRSLRIDINQSKRLRCLRCYSCSGCSIAVFSINSPSLSTLTGDRGNITKTWLKTTRKAATNGKQLSFLNAVGFQGTCSGRSSHIVAGGTIPQFYTNDPARNIRSHGFWVARLRDAKLWTPKKIASIFNGFCLLYHFDTPNNICKW